MRLLGVDVREYYSLFGCYPPRHRALRPFWGAAAVAERTVSACASFFADVTLLQRQMLATLVTAEPLTRGPRILDVDDAIWLHRGGASARRLARLSDIVICGNGYLAENFERWNPNVRVLATGVDTDRYRPATDFRPDGVQRIGWSGESSNFRYLNQILPAIRTILEKCPDSVLRVVADCRPQLEGIAEDRLEFIRWSPDIEVQALQGMTVGIMPLEDTSWARGKCSFKLLTYMACGLPVVASPVGMNAEVLCAGGGEGPRRWQDWVDAVLGLLSNETKAQTAGLVGREAVERLYSVRNLAPRLAGIVQSSVLSTTREPMSKLQQEK
ncbi:MAG: glycosyltransferase family 4 protein [Bryobacteraceae bacterium]